MRSRLVVCCVLASSCAFTFPPAPDQQFPKVETFVAPDDSTIGLKLSAVLARCGEPDRVVSSAVISTVYYPRMTALVVLIYAKHKKHVFIGPTGKVEYVSDIVK